MRLRRAPGLRAARWRCSCVRRRAGRAGARGSGRCPGCPANSGRAARRCRMTDSAAPNSFADLVGQRDAGLRRDRRPGAKREVRRQLRPQRGEQRRSVRGSTASDDRPSPTTRHTSHGRPQPRSRRRAASSGIELAAEVGPAQVGGAVGGAAACLRHLPALRAASVLASASTSSGAWIASRAIACAQPKRSNSSVGMPAPARPSASRAGVAARQCGPGARA